MSIFVYSQYIGKGNDGRQDISGIYDNWEDAIARIRSLYNMDKNIPGADKQYYYFAKER